MRKMPRNGEGRGRRRAALFCSTALSAALLPALGHAQLAPGTTPTGGAVVAGNASIAQAPADTTITQTSQRAAINWQSFDVGAAAQVNFRQPNSTAIALNRVVGGNLSQIDGKITANGQIVLINQSGVVFANGSQVNAESVVVSTSDIPTKNFMAGSLAFTGAPNPGAKIVNHGTITAGQAGLVGLVAPQVANAGVITARLGTITLAGATAFTLDLYGDRLISLDVTGAVRAVDIGGKTIPALVTNSGLILADGGSITLTAQDADALVTQLIDAGGTIRADSVGDQTGTVSLTGIGGNIAIAGNLFARGAIAGAKGGDIQALATGTVSVAPGALLDASGEAGGGLVAVGTDLQRGAEGATDTAAPAAADVTVANGATLRADALAAGQGGRITLLSQRNTKFSGAISVRGGVAGGNGGLAEISSRDVIELGGTVLDTAAAGKAGEILLDPATLVVSAGTPQQTLSSASGTITIGGTGGSNTSYIDPSTIDTLTGTIVLRAGTLLSVASGISFATAGSVLDLDAGTAGNAGTILVDAGITAAGGALNFDAGAITLAAPLSAANIALISGTGGTGIDSLVTAGTLLALASAGTIGEGASGAITAGTLESSGTGAAGAVSLDGSAAGHTHNSVGTLAGFTVAGDFAFGDGASLAVTGRIAASDILLAATSLTIGASLAAGSGQIGLATDHLTLGGGAGFAAGTIALAPLGATEIDLGGTAANALDLSGTLPGALGAGTLIIGAAGGFSAASVVLEGTIALPTATSAFIVDASGGIGQTGTLTAGTADTAIALNGGAVTIGGAIDTAGALTLTGTSLTETAGGVLSIGTLTTGAGSLSGDAALARANQIATLAAFTLGGNLDLNDTAALTIAGDLTTAGAVTLTGDGAITEATGGTIAAGTLTGGTSGGVVTLLGTANAIGTLAAFSLSGGNDFALYDGDALMIAGAVSTTGAVTLGADSLSEVTGGAIDAGTLLSDGSIGGDVVLTIGNAIATLAGFTAAGAFDLQDSVALDVAGALSAIDILLAAPSLDIGAVVTAGTNAGIALAADHLTLGGAGSLIAPGGTVAIAPYSLATLALNGSATTALDLASAIFGQIGTGAVELLLGRAGGYQAADLVLDGSTTLGIPRVDLAAGTLITDNGTLQLGTSSTGTLEFDGAFTQGSSGALSAAILQGDGTVFSGDVLLGSTLNTIGTARNIALLSGTLDLDDTGALTIAGSLSAATISLAAGTLALDGTISPLTALALGAGAGGISESGSITGGTLTGIGTLGGAVALTGTNAFTALGDLTASGTVTIADSTLNIAGTVSAATLILSGTSLTETGVLDVTDLTTGTGSFAGNVHLAGANRINTLSGFTLGSDSALDLNDSAALTIAGDLTTGGAITLTGAAAITEASGGTIAAATLGGGATGGDFLVLDTANSIGTLGGFTFANGNNFALDDSVALTLAGTITTAGAVTLGAAALTEVSGGAIDAGTFASDGSIAGAAILTIANTIEHLAAFTAGGDFALDNAANLTLAGALTADNITIAAPSLDLAAGLTAGTSAVVALEIDTLTGAGTLLAPSGTVEIAPETGTALAVNGTATTALDLAAGLLADISPDVAALLLGQAGTDRASAITLAGSASVTTAFLVLDPTGAISDPGVLTADTLEIEGAGFSQTGTGGIAATMLAGLGTIGGDVALTGTLNTIGTLGLIDTGGFSLGVTDAESLTVAGPLTASGVTLADAGGLTLAGTVSAATAIDLAAASISAGGSAALLAPTIALAAYAGTTDIDLGGAAAGSLDIGAGLLGAIGNGTTLLQIGTAAGFAGNTLTDTGSLSIGIATLSLSGTALNLDGTLRLGQNELILASAGAVTETGGLQAGTLTSGGPIGGAVSLTGTNTIATIGDFAGAANVALADTGAETITGTLSAPGTLVLANPGTIEETGAIVAGTLESGTAAIGYLLLTAANSIATLGAVTVGNTLILDDSQALTIAGAESLATATLSAPDLAFTGDLTATNLVLAATGSVTQSGGAITAGTLTSDGPIGAGVTLSGANSIANLGSFTANGDFALNDATLDVIGTVSAPELIFSGTSLAEAGGVLATTIFTTGTGDFAGDVALTGSNAISTIAGVSVVNTLTINDTGSLQIAGPVTAGAATLSAAALAFAGTVNAGVLALAATAGITQTAGTIGTALLTSDGSIGGAVFLTAANSIASLGGFTGGVVALNDSAPLTLAGAVTASRLTLTGAALDEAGGSLTVQTLTTGAGAISGAVSLGAANSVATLAAFSLGGDFLLNDAVALDLAGRLATQGAVALEDAAAITETGAGVIAAATLDSGGTEIGGPVSLTGGNTIASLAGFTVGGTGFALTDSTGLAIAGAVAAVTVDLASDGNIVETTGAITAATLAAAAAGIALGNQNDIATLADITARATNFTVFDTAPLAIAGTIAAAGSVGLAGAGPIAETTGVIDAAILSTGGGAVAGNVVLGNANRIASLGDFSAAGLTLTNTAPAPDFALTGAISLAGALDLNVHGAVTQSGGAITAATLTSGDGALLSGAFNRPDNRIARLGPLTVAGPFSLADAAPLTLAGNITAAQPIALTDTGGSISQSSGAIVTDVLSLDATDITLADANRIARLGDVASDGTVFIDGAAGIATLAAANATFSNANFAFGGPATVTNTLSLNVAGAVTQTPGTGLVKAATLTGNVGKLASFVDADFATLGSFIMQDSGFALDNFGALTLVGPLVANVVSLTVHGQLTLDGTETGGLFIAGTIEPANHLKPLPIDSVIDVDAPAGAGPAVLQTGTFFIDSGPDAGSYLGKAPPDATLFLNATPSGNIEFAPAPPNSTGLVGPGVDLVADAGATGTISGNVNLYRVVILDAFASQLTGFLDQVGGQAGAAKGFVDPNPKPAVQFNACPIESVNCTILQIESLPPVNPLQNFDIEQRKRRKLDNNVQLPGIATRDF